MIATEWVYLVSLVSIIGGVVLGYFAGQEALNLLLGADRCNLCHRRNSRPCPLCDKEKKS